MLRISISINISVVVTSYYHYSYSTYIIWYGPGLHRHWAQAADDHNDNHNNDNNTNNNRTNTNTNNNDNHQTHNTSAHYTESCDIVQACIDIGHKPLTTERPAPLPPEGGILIVIIINIISIIMVITIISSTSSSIISIASIINITIWNNVGVCGKAELWLSLMFTVFQRSYSDEFPVELRWTLVKVQ